MDISTSTVIALSPIYKKRKDYANLAFFAEDDTREKTSYVLRSQERTGFAINGAVRSRLCHSCGLLRNSVSNLRAQASKKVDIRPDTRLTSKTAGKLSKEQVVEVLGVVRKCKDEQIFNEKKKLIHLRRRMEKGSHKLEFASDVANAQSLLSAVQPFIEERLGKGTEHCMIIEQFMKQLLRKKGAPRYNDKTLEYCMSLVPRTSKEIYDELGKLFLMQTRRYTKKKSDEQISGPGKMEDGP
jgi:hypothetical protein